jgi:hypothetical protein
MHVGYAKTEEKLIHYGYGFFYQPMWHYNSTNSALRLLLKNGEFSIPFAASDNI